MPFPNEHSCRLLDPKQFNKFRRVNNHQQINGKPVDAIFGIIGPGKSRIQALRFRTKHWKASSARSVCQRRKGKLFEPATKKKAEKSLVDERVEEEIEGILMNEEHVNYDEMDDVEFAKWTRAFINSLPNSSFAVIEPDYLSGKTEDKNARHLPYKDKSGKVDLPHLRNARARMNQIKPVTKSITKEALRAKAKKVLDVAAKKHLKPKEMIDELNETGMFTLSTGRKVDYELVEEDDKKAVLKFELIDDNTYNGVYFGKDAIKHQYKEFQKKQFEVSHGMDHSRRSLDQLGEITDMKLKKDGEKLRCIVISEWLKGTDNQNQAHILRKQGRMKYISGGWAGRIRFNEEEGRFEIEKPILREVSSTPTPAKTDAKVQNALDVILSLIQAPELEESDMTEDQEIEPSQEGEVEVEQDAELSTLKAEYQTELKAMKTERESLQQERAERKTKTDQEEIAGLMERVKELGLSEDLFKDKTPDAIRLALMAAKELKVGLLSEQEPKVVLNGEGITLEEGSPEMAEHLLKTHMPWLLAGI